MLPTSISNKILLTFVSDTHNQKPERFFYDHNEASGDILVHSGDFTSFGTDREAISFAHDWSDFASKYKFFLVGLGNHDGCFAGDADDVSSIIEQMKSIIPNIHIVFGGVRNILGLNFGFMPFSPRFGNYEFMADEKTILSKINKLSDVDILVTHSPSWGILDNHVESESKVLQIGSRSIRSFVDQSNPIIHCFGHVHQSRGIFNRGGHYSINAALDGIDEDSRISWQETSFFICDKNPVYLPYCEMFFTKNK